MFKTFAPIQIIKSNVYSNTEVLMLTEVATGKGRSAFYRAREEDGERSERAQHSRGPTGCSLQKSLDVGEWVGWKMEHEVLGQLLQKVKHPLAIRIVSVLGRDVQRPG